MTVVNVARSHEGKLVLTLVGDQDPQVVSLVTERRRTSSMGIGFASTLGGHGLSGFSDSAGVCDTSPGDR